MNVLNTLSQTILTKIRSFHKPLFINSGSEFPKHQRLPVL